MDMNNTAEQRLERRMREVFACEEAGWFPGVARVLALHTTVPAEGIQKMLRGLAGMNPNERRRAHQRPPFVERA